MKQKSNYFIKLQILREMPYKLLHYIIKHNSLSDYINSVYFYANFTGKELIKVMEDDLKILQRNNKIFMFKSY